MQHTRTLKCSSNYLEYLADGENTMLDLMPWTDTPNVERIFNCVDQSVNILM